MKKYLQLTRAHTVPLEAIPAILGASLAAGTLFSHRVWLWGIFGVIYHLAGYGMNSYSDWKNGFDKADKHKMHHPLNTGELSPRTAGIIVYSLLGFLLIYGVYLALDSRAAILVLISGFGAGIIYNEYGKLTHLKMIPISYAHTMVFAVPFIAEGGTVFSDMFILGALYVFVWVFFQIAISGEMKDITQEEENFLRELDTEVYGYSDALVEEGIHVGKKTVMIAGLLKILSVILIVLFAISLSGEYIHVIVAGMLVTLTIIPMTKLLSSGGYNRRERLRDMSLIEMLMLFGLCAATAPVIGFIEASFLMSFSVAWVFAFNRIEWGTVLSPEV